MKKQFFKYGAMVFDLLPDPTGNLKASLSNGKKTYLLIQALIAFPFLYLFLYLTCLIGA